MRHKIVLTGGPGSGKSTILVRLEQERFLSDFIFFDELARKYLSDPDFDSSNKAGFHRQIYFTQIERESKAGAKSFITDRGTIDAFAFHPETISAVGTTIDKEYLRYTNVFQLGSSASLGAEYYKNDSVRNENLEEALIIENNLRNIWTAHPGYRFVKAEFDFDEKYDKIVELLKILI